MSGRKAGYKPPPLSDPQRDLIAANWKLAPFVVAQKGRGRVEYDDAVQQACLGLIHSVKLYDPCRPDGARVKLSTWLFHGARSALAAARKSAQRRRLREGRVLSLSAARGDDPSVPEPAAREPYDPQVEPPSQRLGAALSRLALSDAALLLRYYFAGLTQIALAAELGITRKALSMRMTMARRRLKKILEGASS